MGLIAAGIVTYQPSLSRLAENINAIISQVEKVFVVDNGSDNVAELKAMLSEYDKVQLIQFEKNYGIAKALNRIFIEAEGLYEWVLTLDQDSVVFPSIIAEYEKYISTTEASSLTCLMNDRNEEIKKVDHASDTDEVSLCITSGNMVRVSAWKEVGGFTEELFIDMVDIEFCYKLRRMNHSVIRVNKVLLLHELGHATHHHFLWKCVTVHNHSAMRKYHIIRNTFYLLKKYPQESRQDRLFRAIAEIFVFTILYEKNKVKKISAMIRGAIDSRKLNVQ